MTTEEACVEIHKALSILPIFRNPREVPFDDGLYFFYERGEVSSHAIGGRVVRVGNHPRTEHRLRCRLKQHYTGNKNGSVFRKLIGGAQLRKQNPAHPCLAPAPGKGHWEKQNAHVCNSCKPLERDVSEYISTRMWFRCVLIPSRNERNQMESLLIATLAACPVCSPSSEWLGLHAYPFAVQEHGLWNTQFTDGAPIEPHSLARFKELVLASKT